MPIVNSVLNSINSAMDSTELKNLRHPGGLNPILIRWHQGRCKCLVMPVHQIGDSFWDSVNSISQREILEKDEEFRLLIKKDLAMSSNSALMDLRLGSGSSGRICRSRS